MGAISSGQLQWYHFGDGAISPANVGSGAVCSQHIASGQIHMFHFSSEVRALLAKLEKAIKSGKLD